VFILLTTPFISFPKRNTKITVRYFQMLSMIRWKVARKIYWVKDGTFFCLYPFLSSMEVKSIKIYKQ